ncbi:uncharacterized protein LOC110118659 [Ceratitis capitata]|uniref:uncharacterized protein LOC110118659 n=1 Tax=Ceratitis capitata TaxID=7213 RepID=UPI000A101220|nr:uncharacterized protein LOC110118659 [Ceratitis capitata]
MLKRNSLWYIRTFFTGPTDVGLTFKIMHATPFIQPFQIVWLPIGIILCGAVACLLYQASSLSGEVLANFALPSATITIIYNSCRLIWGSSVVHGSTKRDMEKESGVTILSVRSWPTRSTRVP